MQDNQDRLAATSEQMKLHMEYSGVLGWKMAGNQSFCIDRKINCGGYQNYISSPIDKKNINLTILGDSSAWGWGIARESDTLHHKLGTKLEISVNNLSCPSYNIHKSLLQAIELNILKKDRTHTIVYMGTCEAYCFYHLFHIHDSPRDHRLKRLIRPFENYYHDQPSISSILNEFRRFTKIKMSKFISPLTQKPKIAFSQSMPSTRLYEEVVYCMNLINNLLNGDVLFVLQPSIYHKKILTDRENEIKKNHQSKHPNIEDIFYQSYSYYIDRANECGINICDASSILDNEPRHVFDDYCHPNKIVFDIVSDIISKEVKDKF